MLRIVIPVKNMDKYINKCLDSALKNKKITTEIIVIDFGSTDNTISIIKKYIDKNKNIKLITGKANNVCEARNIGIKMSKYNYITFMDADDYIDNDYYSYIVFEMINSKSDLGFSDYRDVGEDDSNIAFESDYSCIPLTKINNGNILLSITSKVNCESWNKVYLKKIILDNSVFFDDSHGINGEDLLFNLIYLRYVNCVSYIKNVFYNHLIRKNSLGKINIDLSKRFCYIVNYLEKSSDSYKYKKIIPSLFSTLMMQDLKRKDETQIYACYEKYKETSNFNKYMIGSIFTKRNTLKRKFVCLLFLAKCEKIVLRKLVEDYYE